MEETLMLDPQGEACPNAQLVSLMLWSHDMKTLH